KQWYGQHGRNKASRRLTTPRTKPSRNSRPYEPPMKDEKLKLKADKPEGLAKPPKVSIPWKGKADRLPAIKDGQEKSGAAQQNLGGKFAPLNEGEIVRPLGSFKRGGKVKKSGNYLVHAGEAIVRHDILSGRQKPVGKLKLHRV